MTRVIKICIFLLLFVIIFNATIQLGSAQSAKQEIMQSSVTEEEEVLYRETPIGLILSLSNAFLFTIDQYGRQIIDPNSYFILDKILEILSGISNRCVIEGHTNGYSNEFEASIYNAEILANYFISQNKSLQSRIFSIGLGDTEPYSTEDKTYTGKKMDNRIDIIIIEYKTTR